MKYKQANLFKAPIVLLFSKNKYIEMAIYHNMAINLKAKDLNEMFLRGEYPAEGWEVSYKKIAEQKRKHLINKLCVSFCWQNRSRKKLGLFYTGTTSNQIIPCLGSTDLWRWRRDN